MKSLLALVVLAVAGAVLLSKTHPAETKAVINEAKKQGRKVVREAKKLANHNRAPKAAKRTVKKI